MGGFQYKYETNVAVFPQRPPYGGGEGGGGLKYKILQKAYCDFSPQLKMSPGSYASCI